MSIVVEKYFGQSTVKWHEYTRLVDILTTTERRVHSGQVDQNRFR